MQDMVTFLDPQLKLNSKAISEVKGTLCENGLATGARLLLFDVTTSAAHETRRDL
jgi:hypothetical protein